VKVGGERKAFLGGCFGAAFWGFVLAGNKRDRGVKIGGEKEQQNTASTQETAGAKRKRSRAKKN